MEMLTHPLDRPPWFSAFLSWVHDTPPIAFIDARRQGVSGVPELIRNGSIVKILGEDADEMHELLLRSGYMPLEQYEAVREGVPDPTVFTSVSRTKVAPGDSSFVKAVSTAWHRDLYQHTSPYRSHIIGCCTSMPEIDFLLYTQVSEERSLEFLDIPSTIRSFVFENPTDDLLVLCSRRFRIDQRYYVEDPDLADPGLMPFIYPDAGIWTAHIGGSVRGDDADAQHVLERFMSYAVPAFRDRISSGIAYLSPAALTAHRGLRQQVDGRTTLTRRLYRGADR